MTKPRKPEVEAALKVLQYLKNEPGKDVSFSARSELHVKGLLIQIGHHVKIQEGLSLGTVFSLEILCFHGSLRNNLLFLDLLPKQNIGPWKWPLVRLFGSFIC